MRVIYAGDGVHSDFVVPWPLQGDEEIRVDGRIVSVSVRDRGETGSVIQFSYAPGFGQEVVITTATQTMLAAFGIE